MLNHFSMTDLFKNQLLFKDSSLNQFLLKINFEQTVYNFEISGRGSVRTKGIVTSN